MGFRKKFFYVVGNVLTVPMLFVTVVVDVTLAAPGVIIGLITDKYPRWAKMRLTKILIGVEAKKISDRPFSGQREK